MRVTAMIKSSQMMANFVPGTTENLFHSEHRDLIQLQTETGGHMHVWIT